MNDPQDGRQSDQDGDETRVEAHLASVDHQHFNKLLLPILQARMSRNHGKVVPCEECEHPLDEHRVRRGCLVGLCPCREPRMHHLMQQLE